MSASQFQPDSVYNVLKGFSKAKPDEAAKKKIIDELNVLDQNYDIVTKAAVDVGKLNILPGFAEYMKPFDNLMKDLKIVLTLIRLEIGVMRPQTTMPRLPASFVNRTHTCLCPLTILLQAIASSFTKLEVGSSPDKPKAITGLNSVLNGIRSSLETVNGNKIHRPPGIACVIMLHERNMKVTVTSSAPQYPALKGLQRYAVEARTRYINYLKSSMPTELFERVQEAEAASQEILDQNNSLGRTGSKDQLARPAWYKAEVIGGSNMAVTATGQVKPACLLDHLRFIIKRPIEAQRQEDAVGMNARNSNSTQSCAEWLMWVYLLANPDPANPPPPRQPGPITHKKANSDPNSLKKIVPGEGSVTKTTGPPAPLPALGTATGGRGRNPSPPAPGSSSTKSTSTTQKTLPIIKKKPGPST